MNARVYVILDRAGLACYCTYKGWVKMENDEGALGGKESADQVGAFGKKVFFLNPPAVIGEVAMALSEAEFEVYTTRDHGKLARYLRKEHGSLTFINIDEGDDESIWRKWIKSVRDDEECSGAAFGVITMLDDEEKRKNYLLNLGIECGFIVIKLGASKTTEIILRTLEANEARGRRRYVRAICAPDATECICALDDETLRGWIRDLSSVGMSAAFSSEIVPKPGTRLKNMQLNLKGVRIFLNGVIVGTNNAPGIGMVSIVMFEPGSINDDRRAKLRTFIRKTLQFNMDKALEQA